MVALLDKNLIRLISCDTLKSLEWIMLSFGSKIEQQKLNFTFARKRKCKEIKKKKFQQRNLFRKKNLENVKPVPNFF